MTKKEIEELKERVRLSRYHYLLNKWNLSGFELEIYGPHMWEDAREYAEGYVQGYMDCKEGVIFEDGKD